MTKNVCKSQFIHRKYQFMLIVNYGYSGFLKLDVFFLAAVESKFIKPITLKLLVRNHFNFTTSFKSSKLG